MNASSTTTPIEETAHDVAKTWASFNADRHADSPEEFGKAAAQVAQAFIKQMTKVDES